MAQPRLSQAQMPAELAEVANNLIMRLPEAQRPEAMRVCQQLVQRSGDSAFESLMRFSAIVSSPNFSPSMFGTVSLIAMRAGPDIHIALNAFERLLSSSKFNRNVHEAARLAIIRSGPDSSEALSALYHLVDNPSFPGRSLDLALPDRFIRFLDSAIRAGGGESYMAIRCMGSLFCNPHFLPEDLNARSAAAFGRQITQLRREGAEFRLEALEGFSTLLANGSITPRQITDANIHEIVELTRFVIAHPSPLSDRDLTPTPEAGLRAFRLILGNRHMRLSLLGIPRGLINEALSSPGADCLAGLSAVNAFLRASRGQPHLVDTALSLATGSRAIPMLEVMTSIMSNPSLSPLLREREYAVRLAAFVSSLGDSNVISGASIDESAPQPMRPFPGPQVLSMLARDPRVREREWIRIMEMAETLGENASLGLLFLQRSLSGSPGRPFPDEAGMASLVDFTRLAVSAAISMEERNSRPGFYLLIANAMGARGFDMRMAGPSGLFPAILSHCTPDEAMNAFSRLSLILGLRGYTPAVGDFLLELVRLSAPLSAGGSPRPRAHASLNMTWDILNGPNFDPHVIPALTGAISRHPSRMGTILRLYGLLMDNPSFRAILRSPEFAERVSTLAGRIGIGESRQNFLQGFYLLSGIGFTPTMFGQIERISRYAGPRTGQVLSALNAARSTRSHGMLFSETNLQFITSMVLQSPSESGNDVARAIGDSFNALNPEIPNLTEEVRIRVLRAYREFLAGAGDQANQLARAFPRLLDVMLSRQGAIPSRLYSHLSEENARVFGAWGRTYLLSVPPERREQAIEGMASMFRSMSANDELFHLLIGGSPLFEQGRRLAERLMGGFVSPEICFNFGYAIKAIGAGRAEALFRRFGITHFARYSQDMLLRLHGRANGRSDRPVVFAVFPDNDHNGAFYLEGRQLDALLRDFDVIIYERNTEAGFFNAASDFGRSFGRTGAVVIAGHGTPNAIRLGENNDDGMLDLTDADRIPALRSILLPRPSIILASCSTGQDESSIGALISRLLGATLYAPREPGNISNISVDHGRVSATYNVGRGIFSSGRETGERR